MPPEVFDLIREGGVEALLLLGIGWIAKQWYTEKADAKAQREARNQDALTAAQAMTEQKILNQDAKHQIEMRDYRIHDLQEDLKVCRDELMRLRYPQATDGKRE